MSAQSSPAIDVKFPKVLIVGQSFNKKSGGGITMSNLFKGWPKDRIAVASSENLSADIDTSVCEIYYQLGYGNKLHPFPLNVILPRIVCGPIALHGDNINGNPLVAKQAGKYGAIYDRLRRILKFFGLYNLLYTLKLTPDFAIWLKAYNPDIVYSQLSTLELIRFVGRIQSETSKPVAIHMMDDWPSTIEKPGLLYAYWKEKTDREFRLLINRSSVLLSISQEMSDEYGKRYGLDFKAFHNPIDLEFWKSHQRTCYSLSDEPAILYAGRIGAGIESSLESIAKAVELVNIKTGMSIKFILQTESKPGWMEQYPGVHHRSQVSYADLPRMFSAADMLVLPYDFSMESIKFIQFSMPTKAPEYMISGTPILVCAPSETAIVKNAQKNKWAKIVTENNIEKLSLAISELIQNMEERKHIAQNAIVFSERCFDAQKVRVSFRDSLSDFKSLEINY